jgi:hypothetical protein
MVSWTRLNFALYVHCIIIIITTIITIINEQRLDSTSLTS